MNIIGDIGGFGNTAIRLIEQMPKTTTVLLGDLNDRGPNSKRIIQYAIDNEPLNIIVLDSNHGDMFIDYYRTLVDDTYVPRYQHGIFVMNGGGHTLNSYFTDEQGVIEKSFFDRLIDNKHDTLNGPEIKLMGEHVDWLSYRPAYVDADIKGQKYMLTHAPLNVNPTRSLQQFLSTDGDFIDKWATSDAEYNYQWNRSEPDRFHHELPNTISVFGHNSSDAPKIFTAKYKNGIKVKGSEKLREIMEEEKGNVYGIGMDTTRGDYMYGLDLTTLTFYTERWKD